MKQRIIIPIVLLVAICGMIGTFIYIFRTKPKPIVESKPAIEWKAGDTIRLQVAPLKISSGTIPSPPPDGTIEMDQDSNYYFTEHGKRYKLDNPQKQVILGIGNNGMCADTAAIRRFYDSCRRSGYFSTQDWGTWDKRSKKAIIMDTRSAKTLQLPLGVRRIGEPTRLTRMAHDTTHPFAAIYFDTVHRQAFSLAAYFEGNDTANVIFTDGSQTVFKLLRNGKMIISDSSKADSVLLKLAVSMIFSQKMRDSITMLQWDVLQPPSMRRPHLILPKNPSDLFPNKYISEQ